MKYKYLTFIVVFILLSSLALAFTVDVEPRKNSIYLNETAEFIVKIGNTGNKPDSYRIYSPELEWIVEPEPIVDRLVKISPGFFKQVLIKVQPTKYINKPGSYGIRLYVRSINEDYAIKKILYVFIKSEAKASYIPSVKAEFKNLPTIIDPSKEKLDVLLKITNLNLLNLPDLEVNIDSDIENITTRKIISLSPLGSLEIPLSFNINRYQNPGDYVISLNVRKNGTTIYTIRKIAGIKEVELPFSKEENKSSFFFKTKKLFTIKNIGNIKSRQEFKIKTNWFKRIFTSTEPDAKTEKINGTRYLVWKLELDPSEEAIIKVTTSYRIPIYILIAIILLLILDYLLKSPLKLKKELAEIKHDNGGLSEAKVILTIKNNSKKTLKNIEIFERIPNIARLLKEDLISVKPKTVARTMKYVIERWDIEELAPSEERMISYTFKIKFPIFGSIKIPSTKAIYYDEEGKKYSSFSNSVKIK